MTSLLAGLNFVLGAVYVAFGVILVVELRRGWSTLGWSHFGGAFLAMALTCGPHHLLHGLHLVATPRHPAGQLDLIAVAVGLPAGIAWFALRLEAITGGPGDRTIPGGSPLVRGLALLGVGYLVSGLAAGAWVGAGVWHLDPRLTPNLILVELYALIGWYLLRTQLANHARTGTWSLSGIALTLIFPTCALMHASWLLYAASGVYDAPVAMRIVDWASVPAAVYFVWVVRMLSLGALTDWNSHTSGTVRIAEPTVPAEAGATTGVSPRPAVAPTVPASRAGGRSAGRVGGRRTD